MTRHGFYLIGGQQRSPRPLLDNDQNWYEYRKGVILHLDPLDGRIRVCHEYVSMPDTHAPGDPILFKCGSVRKDRLYTCTQTEVIVYSLPGFEPVTYISLPCFNDLHHVLPTPAGNLLVANSGLEMVMELTPNGDIVQVWNVMDEDPWGRFSRTVDYRIGVDLKPHRAHPNHIFYVGDDIWVTRFELRDAVSLTGGRRRLPIGRERIHDGAMSGGRLFFTTVDGSLVIADPLRLEIVEEVDLKTMHDESDVLGWCRGIFVDGDRVWVGFSRIRPTRFRETISWVRQGFGRLLPTRVACYDLASRRCIHEFSLEAHGLNAIYSILPAPRGAAAEALPFSPAEMVLAERGS